MKPDYISCLTQACERSRELNLIPEDFILNLNRMELGEDFDDYLFKLHIHLKQNEGVLGNCFKVSHLLRDLVNDFFKEDCALITIGHVIDDGQPVFHQSMDQRLRQLELGQVKLPINLHCWITLPGGIILDPTFFTTKYESWRGRILFGYYKDMPESVFFYPEFIGSEYLIRTGIPIDM